MYKLGERFAKRKCWLEKRVSEYGNKVWRSYWNGEKDHRHEFVEEDLVTEVKF